MDDLQIKIIYRFAKFLIFNAIKFKFTCLDSKTRNEKGENVTSLLNDK